MKSFNLFTTLIKSSINSLTVVIMCCLLASATVTGQKNESKKLLNAAIYQEEIKGNLQEAMILYEKIVKKYPEKRSVVAEALYRNGIANEKLGKQKARQYYEKVVNNYTDQAAMVQLAQSRLNRFLKTEKPDDVIITNLQLAKERKDLFVINLYEKESKIENGSMLVNSSLSPDGTKLVGIDLSIGQNVAVYDLKSKKVELITKFDWLSEDSGWTYYPVWSPDGKEIAYMFQGWKEGGPLPELNITDLKGKTRTLISTGSNSVYFTPIEWSQDGREILTVKQDKTKNFTIGMVSASSGAFTSLCKIKQRKKFFENGASLSPDGKFAVFADGPEDNLDLFIISTEGGKPSLLSRHPSNEFDPLWSPDGNHLIFIRETKGESLLYSLELKDGEPVREPYLIKEGMQNVDLANWTPHGINFMVPMDIHDIYTIPLDLKTGIPNGKPLPLDYSPTGSNINPVWSHDGKSLAFISYADKPKIVIQNLDNGNAQDHIIQAPGFSAISMRDLCWLPDNNGLSFSITSLNGAPVVYKLDLETGNWQHWDLPTKNWTRSNWGPDNDTFVYSSTDDQREGIYKFNTKTKKTKKIFTPEGKPWYVFRGLKFSRDHKRLTFIMNNSQIMYLDLESGENRMIAEKYENPIFSPDGEKIMAIKEKELTIFSLDGEILHQYNLGQHFSPDTSTYGFDWSPDGKQLVFKVRNLNYGTYLMKNALDY